MNFFGKAEKTRCFSFLFQIVRFQQFQGQTKEGAKLEDLKTQVNFKHGKGKQDIEGPRQKKLMPKG
jgi:hypothetical protein